MATYFQQICAGRIKRVFYIDRHDCIAPIDRAIRCSFTVKAGASRKATIESLIKSTVRRPKLGRTRLIFNIPAYIIYYSQRANQGREWSREKKGQSSRTFNGFVPITRWHFSLRETSFCVKHKAKQFPFGKSINSQSKAKT